jgi:AcrR family transcriptional regulator
MSTGRQLVSPKPGRPKAASTSAAPPIGRRERRAAETRLRLFRCALHLFSERGFQNVTVEDKDHVLGVMAEIQLAKVAEALARAADEKQSIQSVLHHLFLRAAEEPGRSPDLARALISSFLASAGVRKIIAHNMKEGRGMIAGVVAAGQARGEIDPRLKKEKVAIQVLQAFMGTVLFWSLHEQPPLKVWIEDSFQHFWRSIAVSGKKKAS